MSNKPKDKESRRFRFPKGIIQVNIPNIPPFGWEEQVREQIEKAVAKFSDLPKNARVRFEYTYPNGTAQVQIYKYKK